MKIEILNMSVQPLLNEISLNLTALRKAEKLFAQKLAPSFNLFRYLRNDVLGLSSPAEHWVHLRTTNPIESTFATVRLRTKQSRGCGSRDTTLAMVFKLMQSAQSRWKRIKGFNLLELVVNNVQFRDGEQVDDQPKRNAA